MISRSPFDPARLNRRLRATLADPIRRVQLSLAFMVGLLATGTLGYTLLEQMDSLDAFYMTVITITTVGFGEIKPLSAGGRLFTVALVLLGLGGVTAAVSNAAEAVLGQRLWDSLHLRRIEGMIKVMHNHYIVCGYGRMGAQVVRDLRQRGEPFVVIDLSSQNLQPLLDDQLPCLAADATQDSALIEAGVQRARGLVAALDTDADNVLTVLTARGLNPNLFIVARATGRTSEGKLLRAGANRVVSPYEIGGHRMGVALLRPAVHDFLTRISVGSSDMDLGQIQVMADGRLAGQSVGGCELRSQYSVSILAIQMPDGSFVINPKPEYVLRPGETLIIIGPANSIYRLEAGR